MTFSLRRALSAGALLSLLVLLVSPPASAAIDLNTAGEAELMEIPGVGPAMAKRILDYRAAHGGFRSVQDLRNIKGIGQKTYGKIAPHVTVSGAAAPKAAKAPSSAKAAAPQAPAAPTVPPERVLQESAAAVSCYNCKGRFWIDRPISEGWCPYCGAHWKSVR